MRSTTLVALRMMAFPSRPAYLNRTRAFVTFNWHRSLCASAASRFRNSFVLASSCSRSLLGRTLALFGIFLLCAASHAAAQSTPGTAQDQGSPQQGQPQLTSVGSPNGVPYPLPAQHAGLAAGQWQIAESYQYNRISFRGALAPFSTSGFNSAVTRFVGRYWGVEGDLGAGFGSPAMGASASSIFVGAGPRLSFRGRSHFEPFGHALAGVQHFNFGGMNFPMNSTSVAWIGGGGLDYRFDSGIALRVQVDYLGSHFGNAFQRNVQIVTGIVWNF